MLILEIRSKDVNPAAMKLFLYCPIFIESSQSPTVTNRGYSGTSPGDSGILQGKKHHGGHLKPGEAKPANLLSPLSSCFHAPLKSSPDFLQSHQPLFPVDSHLQLCVYLLLLTTPGSYTSYIMRKLTSC